MRLRALGKGDSEIHALTVQLYSLEKPRIVEVVLQHHSYLNLNCTVFETIDFHTLMVLLVY